MDFVDNFKKLPSWVSISIKNYDEDCYLITYVPTDKKRIDAILKDIPEENYHVYENTVILSNTITEKFLELKATLICKELNSIMEKVLDCKSRYASALEQLVEKRRTK